MSDTNGCAETKPKRSQLSFSLRMVVLLILFCSVYFGWVGSVLHRVRRQRMIVAKLESLGGMVEYEHGRGSLLMKYFIGDDAYDHVESVELMGDEPFHDDDLALLTELTEIKGLALRGSHITDRALQYVAQLPKLEILVLNSTSVTAGGLAQLSAADELEELYLGGVTATDDLLKSVATLSQLRSLGLHQTKFTSAGFEHLAGLPHLRHLGISDSSMHGGLRNLDELHRLESLALVNVPITEDDDSPLGGLSNLKKLLVFNTTLTNTGLRHVADLHSLRFLNLQGKSITDGFLVHLAGLHRLEELRLNGTKVSDDGLVHLQQLENLHTLWLDSTDVSDAGLEHIAAIEPLRFLYLSDSKVSAAGLALVKNLDDLGPDFDASKRAVIEELDRLFPSYAVP